MRPVGKHPRQGLRSARQQVYPPAIIDELISWCSANWREHPQPCAVVGLLYGLSLSPFQIVDMQVLRVDPLHVDFALTRTARGEVKRRTVELPEGWLASAVRQAVDGRAVPCQLLRDPTRFYRKHRAGDMVWRRLQVAAMAACQRKLAPGVLAKTGLADAHAQGYRLAGFEIGFAPATEAHHLRLTTETVVPPKR